MTGLEAAASAYRGNALGCHTVAALNAFCPGYGLTDALTFEALTGAPFGMASYPDDPNRLIVPTVDPDLGLDMAFALLGVPSETRWFQADEGAAALALLTEWLKSSSVLLGPVDMGGLTYLRNAQLLWGCDHYVAALNLDAEGLWVVDGEGAAPAVISIESFMLAWGAAGLVEGRGAFSARRLGQDILPRPGHSALAGGLRQACRLMRESGEGPSVLLHLAEREAEILSWPAGRRGLEFVLPSRCQRNMAALDFHRRLAELESCRGKSACLASLRHNLLQQTMAIGRCVDRLLRRERDCLAELRGAAQLEAVMRSLYAELEDV